MLEQRGFTPIEWPEMPDGRDWSPAADSVAAQLVGRGIEAATIERWVQRGLDLMAQEPADDHPAPPLDAALVADAQAALNAYLPDPAMRREVEDFLDTTGLGDDPAFIAELAALGKQPRALLAKAAQARVALGKVNAGSPAHTRLSEEIRNVYRRVYATTPLPIRER